MSKHMAELYVDKLLQADVPIKFPTDGIMGLLSCGTGEKALLCSDCPYNSYDDCRHKRTQHVEIMDAYIKQTYPEILL